MTQPTLDDAVTEAEAAKDEALERVAANADAAWMDAAWRVVCWLARAGTAFTTDDVWRALEEDDVATHEPRALGAIMRRAGRTGMARATDRYVLSARPECHRRPVRVWIGAGA